MNQPASTPLPEAPKPSKRRGQALVELALVLPFLILLVAGLLDVGLLLYAQIEFTAATQEVTRIASLNERTPAQLQTLYTSHLGNIQGVKNLSLAAFNSHPELGGRPGAEITMTLSFPPIGLASIFRSGDILLTSVAKTPILTNNDTSGALVAD